jgi:cell wall-associated NlpC family hydrolase
MVTRQNIVDEARTYLNVRWHHQGRNMAGVDCLGLVILVAHQLGLTDFDTADYGRIPDGQRLRAGLTEHMDVTRTHQPGDVLLMRFEQHPQHVAIVTDRGIIHAYAQVRKVVEHRLDSVWSSRIVAAYSFNGIA